MIQNIQRNISMLMSYIICYAYSKFDAYIGHEGLQFYLNFINKEFH